MQKSGAYRLQSSIGFTSISRTPHYSPFGSLIPNRSWSDASREYRYGFNGKEEDKDGMGGGGSTYDYGFRIYNSNLGKFLSVDPLYYSYAWNSPFSYAENDVVRCIDRDGLERIIVTVDPNTNDAFFSLANVVLNLDYMVVTLGRGSLTVNINNTEFHRRFTKGNCTLYFSELPTSTSPGTVLTGKLRRWAKRACNGSEKHKNKLMKNGIYHVYKAEVQFNFNIIQAASQTLNDAKNWVNEDIYGRGIIMVGMPESEYQASDPEYITRFNTHCLLTYFRGKDYEGAAMVPNTTDRTTGYVWPNMNLIILNPNIVWSQNDELTETVIHEAGHNLDQNFIHNYFEDDVDYEYSDMGLSSNEYASPTIEQTIMILQDASNRTGTSVTHLPKYKSMTPND